MNDLLITLLTFQLAELKRLNKIEKEIEIHARKTLRIPVTAFTVLLDTGLPGVHSSGNSSPKHAATAPSAQQLQLGNNPVLDEKLLIAAVSHSSSHVHGGGGLGGHSTINEIILESKITPSVPQYHDIDQQLADSSTSSHSRVPLLSGDMDENVPQPRPIPVRHRFEINFNNGTDCDMSWVCLFICILLLCVAIPLIYVFWTVEHVDHLHGAHGDDLLHALNSSTGHLGGHPPAAPLPPMKSLAE